MALTLTSSSSSKIYRKDTKIWFLWMQPRTTTKHTMVSLFPITLGTLPYNVRYQSNLTIHRNFSRRKKDFAGIWGSCRKQKYSILSPLCDWTFPGGFVWEMLFRTIISKRYCSNTLAFMRYLISITIYTITVWIMSFLWYGIIILCLRKDMIIDVRFTLSYLNISMLFKHY